MVEKREDNEVNLLLVGRKRASHILAIWVALLDDILTQQWAATCNYGD